MKISAVIITILTLFSLSVYSQENNHKSLFVTVYNDNLGVIRDIRSMNIKKGTSTIELSDVAQQIDPTSVHIKLNGEVLEQNYQYDLVSFDKILQKYVDKDVQLIDEKGESVSGKLLSSTSGQIVLQKKDGGLLMIPSTSKYRFSVGELPEGLITKPTLVMLVKSSSSGNQDVEVSYQTSGMKWHAEYVAVLNKDDSKLDLNSWVSIDNNSGTSYKNANLKLVAGEVNRVQQGNYYPQALDGMRKGQNATTVPQFQEKAFFEYHIYNLQRPTTIANNETKQISLFEAPGIKAVKKYFYRSGGYYYNNNSNSQGKIAVVMEFENKKNNNLGIPMPEGKVRVYKSDGESLEFVGEDMIDHTPKDEKVRLKIGDAFDITANEVQTDNEQVSKDVREQAYEITFKNHKEENVVIEVQRFLGLNWKVLSSSIGYENKDAQNILFKVPVPKNGETVLKFRVRYVYL